MGTDKQSEDTRTQQEQRQAVNAAFVELAKSMFGHLGDWAFCATMLASATAVVLTVSMILATLIIGADGILFGVVTIAIFVPAGVPVLWATHKVFAPELSDRKDAIEDFWDAFWDALDNR